MRATSAKYTKVTQQQTEALKANEMRVSARGNIGVYVTRALELFDGSAEQGKFDSVFLRGIDGAIPIVLAAAEIIRRRIGGLHQVNTITSTEIEEVYEPLEEGLVRVVEKKRLSLLLIKLTLKADESDVKNVGYLPPLDASEVKERQPKRERVERGDRTGEQRQRGDRQTRGYRREGGNRDRDYDRDREDNRRGGDDNRRGGDDNRRGGDDNRRGGDDNRRGGDDNRRGGENRRGGNRQYNNRDDRRGGDRKDNRRDEGQRRNPEEKKQE